MRLFHRTKRKVELTEAGRVFAGEARSILQQVERAAGLAVEANRLQLSRLVVGISPASAHLVVRILKAFGERQPGVHVVVKSLVTPAQVEALRSGRIDVGFLTLPVDREGLVLETILRERLTVALPEKHPLSARKRIHLRALAGETLIIFPLTMSPGRYEQIAGLCRDAGFSLHSVHEVDNIYTMMDLISAGFGVSLMRASVARQQYKGVVFRELQHSPVVETSVAFRSENPLSILPAFVEVARKAASSQVAGPRKPAA